MARVSIVIPAFNAAECIEEALESVFVQEYLDYEIIVVDDGSTDSTRAVLQKYVDAGKIRYFYQQNAGPGAARNRGMDEAQGEYICFLDADDEMVERSLFSRVHFLDSHPDVAMVFTDFYKLNTPEDVRVHFRENQFLQKFQRAISSADDEGYVFGEKYFECTLDHNPFVLTSTVMVRRVIVEKIGHFNTELQVAEDVDYWLRICRSYNIGFIDEPLTKYNNFRSVLTKNEKKFFEDSIVFYSQLLHDLENDDLCRNLLKKKLSVIEFNFAYYLFHIEEFSASKKHFRNSFLWKRTNFAAIKWNIFSLAPRFVYLIKNYGR